MELPKWVLCFFLPYIICSSVPSSPPTFNSRNGDPDMDSIISHMTVMEQTLISLQTQVNINNAELLTVKSKLQITEEELFAVKSELRYAEAIPVNQSYINFHTQSQKNNSELSSVKELLLKSQNEVAVLKTNFQKAMDDITMMKKDLEKCPDPVEFAWLKSEVESLKEKQLQQPNVTVLDSVTASVKSNTNQIQAIKSHLVTAGKDIKNETSSLQYVHAVIGNLTTTVENLDTNYKVLQQDLALTNASVQSTASRVKGLLSQMSSNPSEKGDMRHPLILGNGKSVSGVAFQVTQKITDYASSSGKLNFTTVETNIGGGYNQSSGNFTVPIFGVYLLWANVVFYHPDGFHTVSIYNGQRQLGVGITQLRTVAGQYDFRVASVMTVHHLDQGDQIQLQVHPPNSWINYESSFGGALIHTFL